MGDKNRPACKLEEILDCLGFFWCSINIIVTDSSDIRDERGDEPTRIDEGRKAGDFLAAMNLHRSDFDDAVLVRGETRGFEVHDDECCVDDQGVGDVLVECRRNGEMRLRVR